MFHSSLSILYMMNFHTVQMMQNTDICEPFVIHCVFYYIALVFQVTVNLTPNLVDAGGEVDITVTTKPNAFVGVLAVDQRALMLGTHNHFSQVSTLSSDFFVSLLSQSVLLRLR